MNETNMNETNVNDRSQKGSGSQQPGKRMPSSRKRIAIGSVIAIIVASLSWSIAFAGPFSERHGMGNPMEHILDHVDLSEAQETQVQSIFEKYRPERPKEHRMNMMKRMIELSPEDAQYLQKSEALAEDAADKMKQHMLNMAKARQEIYELLDTEQRQELEALMAKKQRRMEKKMKHMHKHHDN